MVHMTFKKACGQEATEFVLITVLVFFSALFVVFIFGGKIGQFFTGQSSAVKVTKSNSSAIDPALKQKYQDNIDPYTYTNPNKTTASPASFIPSINGVDNLTENPDGSVSFNVGTQSVSLSSEIRNLANSAIQTTGSNGEVQLITEIANMIKSNQSKYPDGQVPVELMFGDTTRVYTQDSSYKYSGDASVNTTAIKVGNQFVVLQEDRNWSQGSGTAGTFKIQGTLNNNNITNATVSGTLFKDNQSINGIFSGGLSNNLISGTLTMTNYSNYKYDWTLDFSKSQPYNL